MTIKQIVLSGGAYKGFYTIGALKYLADNKFFNVEEIEKIYGTSVGALLGCIICLKLNSTFSIRDAYIWIPWPQKHTFLDTATNILDDI